MDKILTISDQHQAQLYPFSVQHQAHIYPFSLSKKSIQRKGKRWIGPPIIFSSPLIKENNFSILYKEAFTKDAHKIVTSFIAFCGPFGKIKSWLTKLICAFFTCLSWPFFCGPHFLDCIQVIYIPVHSFPCRFSFSLVVTRMIWNSWNLMMVRMN